MDKIVPLLFNKFVKIWKTNIFEDDYENDNIN